MYSLCDRYGNAIFAKIHQATTKITLAKYFAKMSTAKNALAKSSGKR